MDSELHLPLVKRSRPVGNVRRRPRRSSPLARFEMLFEVDLGGLSDVTDLEAGPRTPSRERAVHIEETRL